MTANAMDADRDACLAAGMNDHVGKPFDLGSLVATLLRHAGGAVREAPGPLLAASVDLPEGLPEQAARHGIDLRAALQRVEGETEVFLRLLRSFDTELADLADRFDALITGAELEEAGRLMHTIKGLAGMLGAARLHSLAAALEATLRHERRAPGVALHGSLRATLDDTRAGLMLIDAALSDRIERTPPQPLPKASGDRARVRLALAALAPLLERADMGAVDGFESLRHDLGSHFDPETLKPLDDAMMMLDFDRARQRIDELLRSL
jgi:HPt (histidine-containing phosphotransfer) domain-containing protein